MNHNVYERLRKCVSMDDEVRGLLRFGIGLPLLSAVPVSLGVAPPEVFGMAVVIGFFPLLFLGLLWLGIVADRFFGVENAWAYTVPTAGASEEDATAED